MRFFAAVLKVNSVIITVRITKNARYKGRTAKVVKFPKSPNRGGINVVPVYAHAICSPMTAPEFSSPKLCGAEWIILGNTGAQPKPITTNAAIGTASAFTGIARRIIPHIKTELPARISFRSPSLSEINPLNILPEVIPI